MNWNKPYGGIEHPYKVLAIFVTDILASDVYGLNPSIFIAFMSSYDYLMVSLLSIAILKFKLLVQMLFLLYCD